MALIRSVTVGERVIDLHKFTGEVVDEKKWSTTQVSGGGGGYNVGLGQNNPVTISSVSTTHDQFFLKNDSGQEMAVELANAELALRKGHRVTVFWGILQGQERGSYVAIYNHTTNNLTKIDPGHPRLGVEAGFRVGGAGMDLRASLEFVSTGWGWLASSFCSLREGKRKKEEQGQLTDTLRAAVDGAIVMREGRVRCALHFMRPCANQPWWARNQTGNVSYILVNYENNFWNHPLFYC